MRSVCLLLLSLFVLVTSGCSSQIDKLHIYLEKAKALDASLRELEGKSNDLFVKLQSDAKVGKMENFNDAVPVLEEQALSIQKLQKELKILETPELANEYQRLLLDYHRLCLDRSLVRIRDLKPIALVSAGAMSQEEKVETISHSLGHVVERERLSGIELEIEEADLAVQQAYAAFPEPSGSR